MNNSIWDSEFPNESEVYRQRMIDAELDRIDQLVAKRRAESLNRLAVNAAKSRSFRVLRRQKFIGGTRA